MRRLRSILSVIASGILAAGTAVGTIGAAPVGHSAPSDPRLAAVAIHAVPALPASDAGAPHRAPARSGAALPAPLAAIILARQPVFAAAGTIERPLAAPRVSGYDATAPPALNG